MELYCVWVINTTYFGKPIHKKRWVESFNNYAYLFLLPLFQGERERGKLLVVTWNSFLPSFLFGRKKRWKGRGRKEGNAANCEGTRQLSNNRTVAAGAGGTTKWGRSSDASYYFPPRSELRWGNKSELGLNAVYHLHFLPPARWEMRVKKILWMNSTATESRGRKMYVQRWSKR